MSSYLNFYLVPKKKEGQKSNPKPLRVASFSRGSELYYRCSQTLNPAWAGNGDEPLYSEFTASDANNLANDAKDDLQKARKRLEDASNAYKSLTMLTSEQIDSYVQEYTSMSDYIKELEKEVAILEHIAGIVEDLEYSDFEKILINID